MIFNLKSKWKIKITYCRPFKKIFGFFKIKYWQINYYVLYHRHNRKRGVLQWALLMRSTICPPISLRFPRTPNMTFTFLIKNWAVTILSMPSYQARICGSRWRVLRPKKRRENARTFGQRGWGFDPHFYFFLFKMKNKFFDFFFKNLLTNPKTCAIL